MQPRKQPSMHLRRVGSSEPRARGGPVYRTDPGVGDRYAAPARPAQTPFVVQLNRATTPGKPCRPDGVDEAFSSHLFAEKATVFLERELAAGLAAGLVANRFRR